MSDEVKKGLIGVISDETDDMYKIILDSHSKTNKSILFVEKSK